MHKHRRTNRRSRSYADANFKIDESAQLSIIGLASSIDGGTHTATSYLRREYLAKYCDESLVSAAERRANAIAKLRATEERNADTNRRLLEIDSGFNILNRVSYASFVRFARKMIRDILGPLRDAVVVGGFSGGASTSRRRTEGNPAFKFSAKADATESVVKFLPNVYGEVPLLREYGFASDLTIVSGNILFTVPKKTDIDRCACKEPDLNMFLQKGVGRHIRRRLRRFGINLNDQSINRMLAHKGSLSGELATLDLSAASDSMTIELVRTLLPNDWFEYLNDIRSQYMTIDGETFRTEMFSSMGNGFTFELESMLFLVIARTTAYYMNTPGVISVFGDDIIIPSELYNDVTYALGVFGFTANADKSFHEGPFRESCGGHYHNGEDITPFYLKRKPTRLTDVIRVANQFRRWATADIFRQYELPGLYRVWLSIAMLVPRDLWGGYDTEIDTQLASPKPVGRMNKLVRETHQQELPQVGSYLQWHSSNWDHSGEREIATEPVNTIQKCRRRRVKKGTPLCQALFQEEWR